MYSKYIDHICFVFNTADGEMRFYAQRAGSNVFRYGRWADPGTPIKNMECRLSVLDGKMSAISKCGKRYKLSNAYAITAGDFYRHFDKSWEMSKSYHIHLFEIDGKTYALHACSVTDRNGETYYENVNGMPLEDTPFAIERIFSHYNPDHLVDFKITNGIDSYEPYNTIKCTEDDYIMSFYTP